MKKLITAFILISALTITAAAQEMEIGRLVEKIYASDSSMRADIKDLTIMAETFSRKLSKKGEIEEEKRFIKKYLFKDTLFTSQFLEYYKDGVRQDEEDMMKERDEARKKGRLKDAARNLVKPFYPDVRDRYEYKLIGMEEKNGANCYHVKAECKKDDKELLEGDYWFENENYSLVYCEFEPSKLSFPIKKMEMTHSRKLTDTGYWLPDYFHIKGYGKILFIKSFYFEGEEFYTGHQINTGLTDDLFKEAEDEN